MFQDRSCLHELVAHCEEYLHPPSLYKMVVSTQRKTKPLCSRISAGDSLFGSPFCTTGSVGFLGPRPTEKPLIPSPETLISFLFTTSSLITSCFSTRDSRPFSRLYLDHFVL